MRESEKEQKTGGKKCERREERERCRRLKDTLNEK